MPLYGGIDLHANNSVVVLLNEQDQWMGVENHSCNISDGGYLTPLCSGHHVRFQTKQASLGQSKA